MNRIKNECIRGSLVITSIAEKIGENLMRWFGHVKRRNNDDI